MSNQPKNTYIGTIDKDGYHVTVNGKPLAMRSDIADHSPTGYSWGYNGSGPALLALSIMVHEYGDDLSKHPIHYQDLKRGMIAPLSQIKGFQLTGDDIALFVSTATVNDSALLPGTPAL